LSRPHSRQRSRCRWADGERDSLNDGDPEIGRLDGQPLVRSTIPNVAGPVG
jgi:hypothetical protein